MIRISNVIAALAIMTSALISLPVIAGDLSWSGYYRLEGLSLNNSRLDSSKEEKSYILNHLVLMPKIVAADSVQIFSRFDVFNNSTGAANQAGQFMGQPPCTFGGNGSTCPTSQRAVNSTSQASDTIQVSQLWLRWTPFEFGEFIAGRAPVQFGLGMTYNAGDGKFDHFLGTKDLIGYKFIFGNISLMPMYGKVASDPNHDQADITDYMIQGQWENPETDLSLGIFYDQRMSGKFANDAPAGAVINPSPLGTPAATEGWTGKQLNVFVKRNSENIKAGLEAGFQSGKTGVTVQGQDPTAETSLNGFGVAGEVKWKPENGKNTYAMKVGYATGTDPSNTGAYGNFYFSKNYDVALILFNHYVGQPSVYTTTNGVQTRTTQGADVTNGQAMTGANTNTIDDDTVTNAVYLAPAYRRAISDNWDFDARLVWAMLNKARVAGWSSSLGEEADLGLEWRPFDRMTTRLDGGVLLPGSAFSMGGAQPTNVAFEVLARAAITF